MATFLNLRRSEKTYENETPVIFKRKKPFTAFAQPSCPDVQAMLASPSLSVVSKKIGTVEVLGDVSTGVFRPLLPARFRSAAVLSLHNIHHPGMRASRRLVCSSFCWPKNEVGRQLCPND